MSASERGHHELTKLPDNVLEHSLEQILGLECPVVAVARPTSQLVGVGRDFFGLLITYFRTRAARLE